MDFSARFGLAPAPRGVPLRLCVVARWAALFWFVVAASGCMLQNLSPETRLRDAVVGMADDLRWARVSLAAGRVVPTGRTAFVRQHRGFGRQLEIGDAEIASMTVADDRDRAESIMVFRWFRRDTMTLHETTVRQRWRRSGATYYLADWRVVAGDPRLLASAATDASVHAAGRDDTSTESAELGEASFGESSIGVR